MKPPCEDYPCCGHGDGGCPNKDGSFNCSQCGKKLPKKSGSSICARCEKKNMKRWDDGGDFDYSMNY
jgi:hypothetical protein